MNWVSLFTCSAAFCCAAMCCCSAWSRNSFTGGLERGILKRHRKIKPLIIRVQIRSNPITQPSEERKENQWFNHDQKDEWTWKEGWMDGRKEEGKEGWLEGRKSGCSHVAPGLFIDWLWIRRRFSLSNSAKIATRFLFWNPEKGKSPNFTPTGVKELEESDPKQQQRLATENWTY